MLQNLSGWHFLIILVIILLLFGAPKLPALARSLGQSMNILKKEMRPGDERTPGDDTKRGENADSNNSTNDSSSK